MSADHSGREGDAIPPVPNGWVRVHAGRPLIRSEDGEKLALQWCPVCGPSVTFAINEDGVNRPTMRDHILSVGHSPHDFGLAPSREGEDRRLDEFEGGDGDE